MFDRRQQSLHTGTEHRLAYLDAQNTVSRLVEKKGWICAKRDVRAMLDNGI